MRDGPKLVLLGYIKIVVSGFGNSCVNGFHCHNLCNIVVLGLIYLLEYRETVVERAHLFVRVSGDCSIE